MPLASAATSIFCCDVEHQPQRVGAAEHGGRRRRGERKGELDVLALAAHLGDDRRVGIARAGRRGGRRAAAARPPGRRRARAAAASRRLRRGRRCGRRARRRAAATAGAGAGATTAAARRRGRPDGGRRRRDRRRRGRRRHGLRRLDAGDRRRRFVVARRLARRRARSASAGLGLSPIVRTSRTKLLSSRKLRTSTLPMNPKVTWRGLLAGDRCRSIRPSAAAAISPPRGRTSSSCRTPA